MENNIYNPVQTEKKEEKLHHKIKRHIKKPKIGIPIATLLILGAVYSGYSYFNNNVKANIDEENVSKSVKTIIIDSESQNTDFIKTVGSVVPEARVDAVSLTQGTIRGLYFDVGDKVTANSVLASLHSDSVLTNYSNAQISLTNAENSLEAIKRLTDENVKQAELGVQNAEEAVKAAELGLEATKDNYENVAALQDKSVLDMKDTAIISFYDYLNFIKSTLDQVNYIIGAEKGSQISGISPTLGAKDFQSLNNAVRDYSVADEAYEPLLEISPSRYSIENDFKKVILALEKTKIAVDDTVIVLDATISNPNFSEASLGAQKNSFIAIRSNTVGKLSAAKIQLNSLENIGLNNKQKLDQLESAIKSAESQLEITHVSYKNALAAVETAKRNKEQQIIGVQSSLDGVKGQLNLSGTQVSDLSIKAPISGFVTGKYVELGTQVNPGQKIAEVSQTKNLKIKASLTSSDIYRIKIGQKVDLGNELEGIITSIDPAADPVTKKVNVEISFDNKDDQLIAGTFVDISIPLEKIEKSSENSVFIPLKAISITQNDNYVFVVQGDSAHKVVVTIGKSKGGLIEVLSGLNDGDELIVDGARNLNEGDKIKNNS